jgi:hypothetical protein
VQINIEWPPTTDPRLVELDNGDSVLVPFRAAVTDVDWRQVVAELVIDLKDGKPVVLEVHLHAPESISAWPPTRLGRLARDIYRDYLEQRAFPHTGSAHGEDGSLLGFRSQGVSSRRARELARERRAHTVLSDDYLREVAGVYLEAEPTGRPTAAVRERWHLESNTAPKHVAQARKRTDPTTGKPFLPAARSTR